MRRQASILLLAIFALPTVGAHAAFDGGAPLGTGSVHVRIEGAPLVVAGAPLDLVARTDVDGPLHARLVGPDGEAGEWFPLIADEDGQAARIMLDAPGAWRVEVRAGATTARFDIEAWPEARVFIAPDNEAAARGVVVAGSSETLSFMLVDASGAPVAAPQDASVRIEGPDGVRETRLRSEGDRLALETEGWRTGEHRVHVLSREAGLVEGTRPPIGILVVSPEEARVYDGGVKETPAPPAVLALVVLALAALLRRRTTRGRPWRRSCSR